MRRLLPFLTLFFCTATAQAADWETVGKPTSGPTQVIGFYTAGCIQGAQSLAPEGPGYEVIRLSRNRFWGHPAALEFVGHLSEQVRQAGQSHLYIADIGLPRGGPFSYGHASHQMGLDIDIWFERAARARLAGPQREKLPQRSLVRAAANGSQEGIDETVYTEQHAALLRMAAETPGVDRMFVNKYIKQRICQTATGNRAWLRKLVPWIGHDSHFHVRLYCPPGQPSCTPQSGYPQDDGCGEALDVWFRAPPVVAPPADQPRQPYRPKLPPACQAVLTAP